MNTNDRILDENLATKPLDPTERLEAIKHLQKVYYKTEKEVNNARIALIVLAVLSLSPLIVNIFLSGFSDNSIDRTVKIVLAATSAISAIIYSTLAYLVPKKPYITLLIATIVISIFLVLSLFSISFGIIKFLIALFFVAYGLKTAKEYEQTLKKLEELDVKIVNKRLFYQ